jgi:hypothetical protein
LSLSVSLIVLVPVVVYEWLAVDPVDLAVPSPHRQVKLVTLPPGNGSLTAVALHECETF